MSQEIVIQEEVAKQREAAWGQLGRGIYETELKLQVQAQSVVINYEKFIPKTFEEVKKAEEYLAEIKRKQTAIVEQRKEVTKRFDDKAAALMQPEKSLNDPIQKLTAAIIEVKKKEQERVQKEKNKQDEIKLIREHIAKTLAFTIEGFRTKISNLIQLTYEHALNKPILPEEIDNHLQKVSQRVTVMDFAANYVLPAPLRYNTDEEYRVHLNELWVIDVASYIEQFRADLKSKFQFYATDFNNKQSALLKSSEQHQANLSGIKNDAQSQAMAAELEGAALVLHASPEVKELKKAYKIDMEESEANAMLLLAAFIANKEQCRAKLQVKKWFNFSISNIITALEKVKNEDNRFQPQGVVFKEIEKL